MPGKSLNVITLCGSLRKGSYNAMVQRALPSLAPDGMAITEAPPFAAFPLYNADVQNSTGFPAPVKRRTWSALRKARPRCSRARFPANSTAT